MTNFLAIPRQLKQSIFLEAGFITRPPADIALLDHLIPDAFNSLFFMQYCLNLFPNITFHNPPLPTATETEQKQWWKKQIKLTGIHFLESVEYPDSKKWRAPFNNKSKLLKTLYRAVFRNDLPTVDTILRNNMSLVKTLIRSQPGIHTKTFTLPGLPMAALAARLGRKTILNAFYEWATQQNTPHNLWWAAALNQLDRIEQAGPLHDWNGPVLFECSPLWIASHNGHLELVNRLINAGANVNLARSDRITPLYIASQCNNPEVVEALLKAGADINQGRQDGITPFWVACELNLLNIVNILIKWHANIDQASSKTSSTPLFIACRNGHFDIVKTLIAAGANSNLGQVKPQEIARQNGHREIACLLKTREKLRALDETSILEQLQSYGRTHQSYFAHSIFNNPGNAVHQAFQACPNPTLKDVMSTLRPIARQAKDELRALLTLADIVLDKKPTREQTPTNQSGSRSP